MSQSTALRHLVVDVMSGDHGVLEGMMLVRTTAKARVPEREPPPRRRLFRRPGEISYPSPRFQLPDFGLSNMEFDWGHDGIRKTMRVRDGWVLGTFEYDLRGRSLLALPIVYPLAAIFVRVETRRRARWSAADWTSHPDAGEIRDWRGGPDFPDDDGGSAVREPRRPKPPADGAAVELAPPDDPERDGLTPEARSAVALSEEEARDLGHAYVCDGHLLLGLLREGSGAAAEALSAAGVTLVKARRRLVAVVPSDRVRITGRIPRTPRVAVLLASASAAEPGRSGTGELLAALLAAPQSVTAVVVTRIAGGVDAVVRELAAIGAHGER